jgi:hypothetical protein
MWFHQTVPSDRGRSHEAHANGEGCGACGFGLASRASGGLGRHRPAQLRGSARQRAGGADESGGNPVESRAFEWAPLSVSRRRSRDLRKTPRWSAERRVGPRHGPAIPSADGIGPIARRANGSAFRPANFGAPLPSILRSRRVRTDNLDGNPPGCAARQRSRAASKNARRKMHREGQRRNDDVEVCTDCSPPSCLGTAVLRTAVPGHDGCRFSANEKKNQGVIVLSIA